MAFRFRLNEPISKGLRRIGVEQIERAERQLAASDDPESAIHETRKSLKRIRALLRLVRPGLGESRFRAENARFRDIALLLAGARDNHILFETVTKLEGSPRHPRSAALAAVKKLIEEDRSRSGATSETKIAQVIDKLADAKDRFARLTLRPAGFQTIERGLEASYRKCRRAFATAYTVNSDEAFHEWRKMVQQHWRHMALLTRAWPELFAVRVAAARELSQLLGDDHDLWVLTGYVRKLVPERLSKTHAREIERLARARQKQLRKAAAPRGQRLFVEGAKGLSRRIGLVWNAAQQMGGDEDEVSEVTAAAAASARSLPQSEKQRS